MAADAKKEDTLLFLRHFNYKRWAIGGLARIAYARRLGSIESANRFDV